MYNINILLLKLCSSRYILILTKFDISILHK